MAKSTRLDFSFSVATDVIEITFIVLQVGHYPEPSNPTIGHSQFISFVSVASVTEQKTNSARFIATVFSRRLNDF